MRPDEWHLLLRKQRLQLRIARQRVACLGMLQETEELLRTARHLRSTTRNLAGLGARIAELLREHSALGATLGAALLLWRPRGALRWLRSAWLLWMGWRRGRGTLRAWMRELARRAGT